MSNWQIVVRRGDGGEYVVSGVVSGRVNRAHAAQERMLFVDEDEARAMAQRLSKGHADESGRKPDAVYAERVVAWPRRTGAVEPPTMPVPVFPLPKTDVDKALEGPPAPKPIFCHEAAAEAQANGSPLPVWTLESVSVSDHVNRADRHSAYCVAVFTAPWTKDTVGWLDVCGVKSITRDEGGKTCRVQYETDVDRAMAVTPEGKGHDVVTQLVREVELIHGCKVELPK